MIKSVLITGPVMLIIGIVIGSVFFGKNTKSVTQNPNIDLHEVRSSGYKFISPLLECETGQDYYKLTREYPLQDSIRKLIDAEKEKETITDASVYFRDLNNGPWFGVDEHAPFSPASLLKLPVMMAYFKKADTDPSLLSKKLKYEAKDTLLKPEYKPKVELEVGKSYTIEELIRRMMIYSDNASLTLLEDNIEQTLIDKITLDLGVETATQNTPDDFMSVKGYAGLFRILYNASYLEKDSSEKALEILSKTEFNDGIVKGVPRGTLVSHKFGEREVDENIVQLHDCGIVYHPNGPYLLCVMTRGRDLGSLANLIAKISETTYKEVQGKSVSGTN